MATLRTLTGNLADIFGVEVGARNVTAEVTTNIPHPGALIDHTNKVVHLPKGQLQVDDAGDWSIQLPDTSSPDLNVVNLQYRLVLTATLAGAARPVTWDSGFFSLTANRNIADDGLLDSPVLTPSWRSAFTGEMETVKDEAVAATGADRSAVAADRAYVEGIVITDLGTTDGQTKALIETPSSETAQALSATFARLVQVVADGTDQTAEINAALSGVAPAGTRKTVRLVGDFTITAPLVIGSDTTLDATDAAIILAPGSDCNMLRNVAYDTSGAYDTDILVYGGWWDRGTSHGSGNNTHSLLFGHVKGLTVRDMSFVSAGGKYHILVQDFESVIVEGMRYPGVGTFSDGVHLIGPGRRATIRDIEGLTKDDIISLTAKDYPAYNPSTHPNGGDLHDITIENVQCAPGTHGSVKVLAGPGRFVDNITIRSVKGYSERPLVNIFSDTSFPETTGGNIGTVKIDDVQGEVTVGNYLINCNVNTQVLEVTNVAVNDSISRPVCIDGPATVDEVRLSGVRHLVPGTISSVQVRASATVNKLVGSGLTRLGSGVAGHVFDVAGIVRDLTASDVRTTQGEAVLMVAAGGRVGAATLSDIIAPTGAWMVRNNGSAAISVTARAVDTGGKPLLRLSGGSGCAGSVNGSDVRSASPAVSRSGSQEIARVAGEAWVDVALVASPREGDILNNNGTALPTGAARFSGGQWASIATPASTYTPTASATLMGDTFTRSGELVGSAPEVAPGTVWEGSAGKWATNGTHAVPVTLDSSPVGINYRDNGGALLLSGTITADTSNVTARQTNIFVRAKDNLNGIRLRFTLTNAASINFAEVIANTLTASATFPGGTLPSSTPATEYAFSIEVTPALVTCIVNGTTQTITPTSAGWAALMTGTRILVSTNDPSVKLGNLTLTTA